MEPRVPFLLLMEMPAAGFASESDEDEGEDEEEELFEDDLEFLRSLDPKVCFKFELFVGKYNCYAPATYITHFTKQGSFFKTLRHFHIMCLFTGLWREEKQNREIVDSLSPGGR